MFTVTYHDRRNAVTRLHTYFCLFVVMAFSAGPLSAQSPAAAERRSDSTRITFGGFVDAYYAYDFNRPASFDRQYTTQPARHNEFNINLAFVEARLSGDRVRGRLALQAGTSVQSNYAAEPAHGTISGPDLARHIQEAVVGVRLADGLWVDGGIYFSHIGFESFISRDNWTYTRSLVGDFSPFYQAGVKISYQISEPFSAQLHILNGWQNISESNSDKAIGLQLAYAPSQSFSVTYNNFIGNEAPDSVPSRLRFFNDLVIQGAVTDALHLAAVGDAGLQKIPGGGSSMWYGTALQARLQLGNIAALVGRVEYYADEDQVIVVTGTPHGFQTCGASLGLDVIPFPDFLWRVEARGFSSKDPVYPFRDGTSSGDAFVVSSFGLTF